MGSRRSEVHRAGPDSYVFTSTWELNAPPDHVFAALADLYRYPAWWPEFKQARPIDEDHGEFTLRSVLPLSLHFTLQRDIEDADAGHLRAIATGDITGTLEWRVKHAGADTTRADFREVVTLTRAGISHFQAAIRPALLLNHELAMRSGHRGLTTYLM